METCRPYGRTGSTTGANGGNDTNCFHDNTTRNGRYRDRISSNVDEERRPGESLEEYLERQEALNGNHCPTCSSSRSTFRSGSELTSDSDFMDERRNSNQSDTDVFFPSSTEPETNGIHEQKRILDQKRRELPPGHRSWKRVADYVNGLPIIPEPSSVEGGVQNKNIGQAKRQRIWSEGHERRSFAEEMTSQKQIRSTSSSNLSMLSSLSSLSSSYAWCESGDDFDKTLVSLPEEQLSPPPPPPKEQAAHIKHGWNDNQQTPLAVKLPLKPRALVQERTFHGFSPDSPSQGVRSSPREGSAFKQETLPIPNKDKPLHRRLTNSDLIALASQHRQQHTTHRRRQNLHQMGTSNVSDSSDTDTSGQSYSSIDDLLIARHDPEEILLNLGFGGSPEKDILDRIPSRFLQQQSRAQGISTHQFLYQMDELERGCGFSLVGGLRSLGSALRRSSKMSPSPTSSRGPTPPSDTDKSVKIPSEPHKNQPNKVLPDDTNIMVEIAVNGKEVKMGHNGKEVKMGHKVKGRSKLVEQSNVTDIELTPLEESPQVCHETLPEEGRRTEVAADKSAAILDNQRDGLLQTTVPDTRYQSAKNEIQSVNAKLDNRTEQNGERNNRAESELEGRMSEKCSPRSEVNNDKGSMVQPRIIQLTNAHSGVANGRRLQAREDSFEFEELSSEERPEDVNGAIHAAEAVLDNQGNLSRSDSTQSDSSGFADENMGCSEMDSPKSTSDCNTTITSDTKITQTSFDTDTMELLDSRNLQRFHSDSIATSDKIAALTASQESSQGLPSVTSLDDSPFDDAIVVTDLPNSDSQRTRCCTYPAAMDSRVEESGPKTIVEILSSLHTTSKTLKNESKEQVVSGTARRRPPKLMKMKSVDPEGYGFMCTSESRGVQTRLKEMTKGERSCEVLHEVDEDVLSLDRVSYDEAVGQRAKDDRPVQSAEHSIPDEPCDHRLIEKCHNQAENNYDEVCEGSDAAPVESKVIPFCTSQKANERLSLAPSLSAQCLSVKSEHCSESEHKERCIIEEINPAIPVLSESVQLSSQVDNSCKSTENLSKRSLSENLSSCITESIYNSQVCCCDEDVVDGEKKEGLRMEQTLSDINQSEISSQTSDSNTDDIDISYFKCHWDKRRPFSAYSSSEFEVEDSEINKEIDLNERLEHRKSISIEHIDEEEEVSQPVEREVLTTSSTVETSLARSVVALNQVLSLEEDTACFSVASVQASQPITTQDSTSYDTMLPATKSLEPFLAFSESVPLCGLAQPSIAQSPTPVVLSSTPNPSHVAESNEEADNPVAQFSESPVPSLALSESLSLRAKQPFIAQSITPVVLSPKPSLVAESDERANIPDAQSSKPEEDVVEVPEASKELPEAASQSLSDRSTRIEMISEEEHCKAREELKELLSSQDYPSSSSPLCSARSANHHQAVEDLKLLQRALVRYDRDLEELETWSSKLYKEVGFALSPEERSGLQSLSSVRHNIKDEIQSLEKNLMEKFQAVVSMDKEHESKEDTLWSPGLTQIMCQMVDLLKEQTSLRRFLDELHALEYTPPLPTWSSGASPSPSAKRRNLLADATYGGSVDEGDEEDPLEGEAELTDEVTSISDLAFPQVMTQGELIEELNKAQTDLKKMRVQAKQDVVMAVREVRQSILSEVRREIHMESQLLQVQMQAKDIEIENLRSMVKELKETSLTVSSFETSFRDWSRDKDS